MTGKVKVTTYWRCQVCDAGATDVPYYDKRAEDHTKATQHPTTCGGRPVARRDVEGTTGAS